jgi:DNA-binding HxlR family transcriptional regulator
MIEITAALAKLEIDMIKEITAALAELENKGIVERTGEMRWAERSREWRPVYALSELGRALSAAGVSLDDYQDRAS